jgi:hypothetical protein
VVSIASLVLGAIGGAGCSCFWPGAGVLVTTVLAALTTGPARTAQRRRRAARGRDPAGHGGQHRTVHRWQVVHTLGTYFVTHALKGTQEAYGEFGLVLGLVAWIYLLALVPVVATEINLVAS